MITCSTSCASALNCSLSSSSIIDSGTNGLQNGFDYEEPNYPSSIYDLAVDSDSDSEPILPPLQKTSKENFFKNTEHWHQIRFHSADQFLAEKSSFSSPDLDENIRTPPPAETGSDSSFNRSPGNSDERFSDTVLDELEGFPYSHSVLSPSDSVMSPTDYTSTNPLSSSTDSRSEFEFDLNPFEYDVKYTSTPYKASTNADARPVTVDRRTYDTASLMLENDDLALAGMVNCNEVLRTKKIHFKAKEINTDKSSTDKAKVNKEASAQNDLTTKLTNIIPGRGGTLVDEHTKEEPSLDDTKKGKITLLQRKALDCIFDVTDRPSRGLVLHIATELSLHHITVKNFFSNGRRRLRRAAARLNDPERTRRENLRRKEKRRLAALAAAASAAAGERGQSKSLEPDAEGQSHREPPVLSPERKALMEKLAVKVQKSVAQKGLAAMAENSAGAAATSPYVLPSSLSSQHSFPSFNNFQQSHSIVLPTSGEEEADEAMNTNQDFPEEGCSINEDDLVKMLATGSSDPLFVESNSYFTGRFTPMDGTFPEKTEDIDLFYNPSTESSSAYVDVSSQNERAHSPMSWQTLIQS